MSLHNNFPPDGFNLGEFGNDALDSESNGSVLGKRTAVIFFMSFSLKLTFKFADFNFALFLCLCF